MSHCCQRNSLYIFFNRRWVGLNKNVTLSIIVEIVIYKNIGHVILTKRKQRSMFYETSPTSKKKRKKSNNKSWHLPSFLVLLRYIMKVPEKSALSCFYLIYKKISFPSNINKWYHVNHHLALKEVIKRYIYRSQWLESHEAMVYTIIIVEVFYTINVRTRTRMAGIRRHNRETMTSS